ncbi:MAG: hypothetical protein ACREUD_03785 [Gammaproteobacteria bacterium]
MKKLRFRYHLVLGPLITGFLAPAIAQTTMGARDRTVLPIAEPRLPTITELDARRAEAPPRFEVKAPKGADRKRVFAFRKE